MVGSISSGTKRKCFVIGPDGQPEMRDIIVGMSNERKVEVKPWDEQTRTGLKEGERVVENPRPLLPEDSDLKPGKVRPKADSEGHDQGGGDPGKKAGGKKKSGNGPGTPGAPGNSIPGKGGDFIKKISGPMLA